MFQLFFKYPRAVFTKGTFVLLGAWPKWVLIGAVWAAAALLAGVIWHQRQQIAPSLRWGRAVSIWALQTALAILLLVLLWQPAISVPALKPQQNVIAVVVDDSRSMSVADANGTRLEEAVRLLNRGLLKDLSSRFQVRLYRLNADVARINRTSDLRASGTATHIGAGLRQLADEADALPI